MEKIFDIQRISFEKDSMLLTVNNQGFIFNLIDISLKLLNANEVERNDYVISVSGYGIHWPHLDEDLSVSALLKIAGQPQVA